MNNKGLIYILILAVIIFGVILYNQRNTPQKVVNDFYKKWISYEGSPVNDKLYKNTSFVTDNFIVKIDSFIGSFNHGGYDPILCAQDVPQRFKIENVLVYNNEADLTVIENFDQSIKNVNVLLKKIGNEWKIDQINCEEEVIATESNFIKQGNIVRQDNNITLLYEEPGNPALTVKLIFNSLSTCLSASKESLNCNEINFEAGQRVEVKGLKQDNSLNVYSLLFL